VATPATHREVTRPIEAVVGRAGSRSRRSWIRATASGIELARRSTMIPMRISSVDRQALETVTGGAQSDQPTQRAPAGAPLQRVLRVIRDGAQAVEYRLLGLADEIGNPH
jgi:hypothetical protein